MLTTLALKPTSATERLKLLRAVSCIQIRSLTSLEEQKLMQDPLTEQRSHETGFLKSKKREYQRIKAELEVGQSSFIFVEHFNLYGLMAWYIVNQLH